MRDLTEKANKNPVGFDAEGEMFRFNGSFVHFPLEILCEIAKNSGLLYFDNIQELTRKYPEVSSVINPGRKAVLWYDYDFQPRLMRNLALTSALWTLAGDSSYSLNTDSSRSAFQPVTPAWLCVVDKVKIKELKRVSALGKIFSCQVYDETGAIPAVWPVRTYPWNTWCVDSDWQFREFSEASPNQLFSVYSRLCFPVYETARGEIIQRKSMLIEAVVPSLDGNSLFIPPLKGLVLRTPLTKLVFHNPGFE